MISVLRPPTDAEDRSAILAWRGGQRTDLTGIDGGAASTPVHNRVTKATALASMAEATTPQAAENLAGLKKDALAAEAARRVAGTGWLPACLRPPFQ